MSLSTNLIRKRPQSAEVYLAIYKPSTILAASVNNAGAAKGDRVITYDNVTAGSYLNVISGMTLYVGLAQGKRTWRVRVISATSTTLTIAENSDILWQDNIYLEVVNFFEVWGEFPRIVLDANNVPTFYKDYDIGYTNQNTTFDPVVIMGPNRALFAGESINYCASGSYDIDGSTISSYLWGFEGGSVTGSTSHSPSVTYNTPGDYVTKVTITASDGKSFTGYRHVVVLSSKKSSFEKWGFENIEGDWEKGHYSTQVWLRDNVYQSSIVDGALVIIFADVKYDTTIERVTLITGYIQEESISLNAVTSKVTFNVVGVCGAMTGRSSYGATLDFKGVAATWNEMASPTVDKAALYYLRWQSTVLQVADFRKSGNTLIIPGADFPAGPLYNAVNSLFSTAIFANMTSDREGTIWCETDLNLVATGSSRDVGLAQALNREDWRAEPSFPRTIEPRVSYIELGGVTAEFGASPTYGAYLSGAPGNAPGYFGTPLKLTGLATSGQTHLNTLSGLVYADKINPYANIIVPLANQNLQIEIAPQRWWTLNVRPADTVRGVDLRSLRTIPKRVTIKYDASRKYLLVDATLKGETSGPPGDTILVPVDVAGIINDYPPYDYTIPTPVVLPVTPQGDGRLVYAATATYVGRTRTFLSSPPSWENVTGAILGTIKDFALDPFDPKNRACVVSSAGIYVTTNLDDSPPGWTNTQTATQFQNATGKALSAFIGVRYTIAQQNLYWVQATTTDGYLYIGCTQSNGSSWTWKQVGTTTVGAVHGFWVSQHVNNKVFTACGNGELWYSNNANAANPTYTLLATILGGSTPLANVHIPYENNPADQEVWVGGGASGSGETGYTPVARYDGNQGWTCAGISGAGVQRYTGKIGGNMCDTSGPSSYTPQFSSAYGSSTYEFSVSGGWFIIDTGVAQPYGASLSWSQVPDSTIGTGVTTFIYGSNDLVSWTSLGSDYNTFGTCVTYQTTRTVNNIGGYRYLKVETAGGHETNYFYFYISNGGTPGGSYKALIDGSEMSASHTGSVLTYKSGDQTVAWCQSWDSSPAWNDIIINVKGATSPQCSTAYGDTSAWIVIDTGVVQPSGAAFYGSFTSHTGSWSTQIEVSVDGITWVNHYDPIYGGGCAVSNNEIGIGMSGYRYVRIGNWAWNRNTDFYYAYLTNGFPMSLSAPFIKKSTNGGSAFTDVTPSSKGALGFKGLNAWVQDTQRVMALAGAAASLEDLFETADGGASWVTRQSGLVAPVDIGRWPYNTNGIYLLQSTVINYSADGGVTLLDKTGDWATVMGSSFANPVAIVPVWTEP